MSWGDFYERFWSDFRESYRDLPTDSGWLRKPDDTRRNYVGVRSDAMPHAYCHVAFRGHGKRRNLIIEYFTGARDHAGWQELLDRIDRAAPSDLALEYDLQAGASSARVFAVVAAELTLDEAERRRRELQDRAATTFRTMLDCWKP